jgi:cytochrome b pre-mRNA-processing protein 3
MAALGDPQTFSIGGRRFLRTFEGMLQWFSRRAETSRRAQELYGSVVAAARQPSFYRDLGVPDTPEGRFELVALHLFLALENLRQNAAERDLVQRTIEAFVTDMDDCMREMGVGDLTVPKKVRRAAAAFYERAGAYRRGLAEKNGPGLEDALANYVFNEVAADAEGTRALAGYVRKAASLLSATAFEQCVASGELMKLLARNEAEVS